MLSRGPRSQDWQLLLTDRLLHLILMPTEQCNFRCVYCYEDFAGGVMPREVVKGVKKLIDRRAPHLDLLAVEWFGGEPLLARSVVEEIQGSVVKAARQSGRLETRTSMTTNASLLTPEVARRLLRMGVRKYQISLDGTREAHNQRRRGRGSIDSHGVIWRHLLALQEIAEEYLVVLRVHVDRENIEDVKDLLLRCGRQFGDDPRFVADVRRIGRLGGPNDHLLPVLTSADEETLRNLRRLAAAEGLGGEGQRTQPSLRPIGCYAAAANSLVIRSDGRLAKCTVALRDQANDVGRLEPDGSIVVDEERLALWVRGILTGDPAMLECPNRTLGSAGGRGRLPVVQ